ncbi:MAG TPA: excalibur calcium-binding domain-containing protein [Pyrinomonadaceae bacterium]|nr:excalibur calcium-binding domain-containing protein [Pyrinomonadaceae bacterium]
MQRKGTHIGAPSEFKPSRRAVTILVALLVVAVGAFAYYCYRFVQRQAPMQQSAVATPITTPEPQASPSVAVSKKRAYVPPAEITTPEPQPFVASEPTSVQPASAQYRCDGRTRCSQMTSCDEATFFLRNCPGTQMDGDSDGIPCEQQWCGH